MEATRHAAVHAGNHLCARESVTEVHLLSPGRGRLAHSKKMIYNLSKKLYF